MVDTIGQMDLLTGEVAVKIKPTDQVSRVLIMYSDGRPPEHRSPGSLMTDPVHFAYQIWAVACDRAVRGGLKVSVQLQSRQPNTHRWQDAEDWCAPDQCIHDGDDISLPSCPQCGTPRERLQYEPG